MGYLIYTSLALAVVIIFVGRRFYIFWKAGFIGVGIMLLADLLGTGYNLYAYPQGILWARFRPCISSRLASSILYLRHGCPAAGPASRLYNPCLCFVLVVKRLHYIAQSFTQLEPRLQLYFTNFWIINAGLFIRFCDKRCG